MDIGAVATFWGVSILFVVTPGADWAYAITSGIRNRVAPAVIGLLLGHVTATVVVAAGVGTLVAGMSMVLTVLTIAGAAYLVWLGASTLIHPASPWMGAGGSDDSWSRWALTGFGVSGLNPKVVLLFLALLPQFISASAEWPVAVQISVLGLVHVASCAVVYTVVALSARAVLGARPTAARIVSRVSGAAMIAVGGFLLVDRLLLM